VGVLETGDPVGGGGEQDPLPGVAGGDAEGDRHVGFPGAGSDSDRLQHLRAVLPCEVRVTAATHPLFGLVVAAHQFRRADSVLFLVVTLPDGSPGMVRADATDVLGGPAVEPGVTVLDGDGVWALRALVARLKPPRRNVPVGAKRRQIGSTRP
jgi:hypothetical protein